MSSAKENFKLKLKAMRLRIKKKREEFLKFTSRNTSSSDDDHIYLNNIKPELEAYSLFDGIPCKSKHCPSYMPDNTIISVDIAFDQYTIDLNHKSKSSLSRTSTPIFYKRQFKISSDEDDYDHEKNSNCSKRLRISSSKKRRILHDEENRFFNLEKNNFHNYNMNGSIDMHYLEKVQSGEEQQPKRKRNRHSKKQRRSFIVANYESQPDAFQDFGEIKIWYV